MMYEHRLRKREEKHQRNLKRLARQEFLQHLKASDAASSVGKKTTPMTSATAKAAPTLIADVPGGAGDDEK
jgi:hypothetical protein